MIKLLRSKLLLISAVAPAVLGALAILTVYIDNRAYKLKGTLDADIVDKVSASENRLRTLLRERDDLLRRELLESNKIIFSKISGNSKDIRLVSGRITELTNYFLIGKIEVPVASRSNAKSYIDELEDIGSKALEPEVDFEDRGL